MKILLAMNLPYSRWSGGANRANRYLLEGLAARGHTTAVIVPLLAAPATETEQDVLKRLADEKIVVERSASVLMYTMTGVRVHSVRSRANLRAYLRDQVRA